MKLFFQIIGFPLRLFATIIVIIVWVLVSMWNTEMEADWLHQFHWLFTGQ
jgi:hypothetical protein